MRDVDLGWIRVFVTVGRLGSFSDAAKALNITQPAVSYQIRRVEDEFGAPLLLRRHRGVELTDAGRELFDLLQPLIARVDRIARRTRSTPRRNMFRLHTDYAFSGLWLIPRIHRFHEANPGVNIEVIASQHTDASLLEDGDIVIAFGNRAELGPDAILLMPEVVVPVCAPSYAFETLSTARLIHLDGPQPAPWFTWDSYLAAVDSSANAAQSSMRFNTYSLVVDAAVAGQGVMLGWRGLVDSHLARGALVTVGPDLAASDRGYFMLKSADGRPETVPLRHWLTLETSCS